MKKQISGKRYDYIIELSEGYFEVIAIRKQDKRRSAITNVNYIIGEIIEPILKTRDIPDTIIKVNKKDGLNLFSSAVDALNDEIWGRYLENQLYEDFEYDHDYEKM
ncbi:MAG: hypothetical protein LBH98_03240 [Chitinispirillales bacterium]|jgi:hypothetical protein|nr:hypothetical protein [Chitinispirillales bacterium]